jgi:S-adenosylmethionine:tRNA ribosyltransferase-isomerase
MNNNLMLSNYDYELPSDSIAQTPAVPRDSSRLLIVDSLTTHHHSIFHELVNWLSPGDLLVLNNSRVIPARLYGRKSTGAKVEILLLEEKSQHCWLALVKPGKRFHPGTEIWFDELENSESTRSPLLKATVVDRDEETGGRLLKFEWHEDLSFWDILEKLGEVPLPPYISDPTSQPSQYQTVYANPPGSVAAPTAGLHFTEELLEKLEAKGIQKAYVTLHIGVGTFRPVEVEDITQHKIHQEWVEIPQTTVDLIEKTKSRGGKVIAVGTTAVRSLESASRQATSQNDFDSHKNIEDKSFSIAAFRGKTDIFIYPGYQWRVVDGLITNFHLPRSSLLMLVSAFIGRQRLLDLYEEAIAQKYRFYSFGDAMLILPDSRLPTPDSLIPSP